MIHATRLDRWLGESVAENISQAFRLWQGPPVIVHGTPGKLWVEAGGDFCGTPFTSQRRGGFSSLSDLIAARSAGQGQDIPFSKTGTAAGSVGQPMSLWNVGNMPAAGGVGGTSGTGRACTNATTGALGQSNAATGTLHLISGWLNANFANSLLVYDRLWDMTYNHATATSTAIDANNRPTRYQTSALAPGNFISAEVTTALSATAHNLTLTYVDDQGNTAEAAAAYAAPVSAAANRLTLVSPAWFLTLNAPDVGARYLTNIAQSTTASVTGVSNFFIGHPLFVLPAPIANLTFPVDGVNCNVNLARIIDGACLAFLELPKPATNATTYTGLLSTAYR